MTGAILRVICMTGTSSCKTNRWQSRYYCVVEMMDGAEYTRGSEHMQWTGLFLVYPNIVHLESGREIRPGRITAVRTADGEVQNYVMRLMKGILAFGVPVERVLEVGRVQQDVVNK